MVHLCLLLSWWRHQMGTCFRVAGSLWGESPVIVGCFSQRPGFVPCSTPTHCRNKNDLFNLIVKNLIQWNLNQNIKNFFEKVHFIISSAKYRLFCAGPNMLYTKYREFIIVNNFVIHVLFAMTRYPANYSVRHRLQFWNASPIIRSVNMWRITLMMSCFMIECKIPLEGNHDKVTGKFPSQRPVARCFDVFFVLCLNKWLSKQSRRPWFETPSRSLWRHFNEWDS